MECCTVQGIFILKEGGFAYNAGVRAVQLGLNHAESTFALQERIKTWQLTTLIVVFFIVLR